MPARFFDYGYIAATMALTIYGQIVVKWRVGLLPPSDGGRADFLIRLLLDPFVLSGFAAAFLASLTWMLALSKFEIGYAYPFQSLNFVVVTLLGVWLFMEPFSAPRFLGVCLIVIGTAIVART